MKFEDALGWVLNGGRARRAVWAKVPCYTRATPPLGFNRMWRIWKSDSTGQIMQGWGGQIGMELAPDDPIRDGTDYIPTDADRVADDWEVFE